MNTTGNDVALRSQPFAAQAADKAQSGIRNVRRSAATVEGWFSHEAERSRARSEVGLRTEERATLNILTIVGMACFFALMLGVGFFGERLMW